MLAEVWNGISGSEVIVCIVRDEMVVECTGRVGTDCVGAGGAVARDVEINGGGAGAGGCESKTVVELDDFSGVVVSEWDELSSGNSDKTVMEFSSSEGDDVDDAICCALVRRACVDEGS